MAALDQIASFLQQGVQNIGALTAAMRNGVFYPNVSGGVLGFSLGTASAPLLSVATTQQVTFHNLSGTATAWVCPAFDANSNALAAGSTGGNWTIGPLEFVTLTVQTGPYLARASITATPLTVGLGLGQ